MLWQTWSQHPILNQKNMTQRALMPLGKIGPFWKDSFGYQSTSPALSPSNSVINSSKSGVSPSSWGWRRYLPSLNLTEPHRTWKDIYHILKVTSSSSSTLTFQVKTVSLFRSPYHVKDQISDAKKKSRYKLYQPIVVVTKHDGKNTSLRISKAVTTCRSFHLKSASSVETGLAMHGC